MAIAKADGEVGKRLAFHSKASERISADRFSLLTFFFCVFAILGQTALILVTWEKLPPKLPLFYLREWGDAMLAASFMIWILPAISLLTFVLNYSLAFFALRGNFFLMRVLVVSSLIVCLATLYDVAKIVSLLT